MCNLIQLPLQLLGLLALVLPTITLALPTNPHQQRLSTPLKDCTAHITPSLSQTYNWTSPAALLLAQCLLTHTPRLSTCVFYTSSSRTLALRYATESNLTTIYDVYPPSYFNISVSPASQWNASGHLRDLFRITSKAYAIACSGRAELVMPNEGEPCRESIWVTDEWEAIRSGSSGVVLPVWRVSWAWDEVRKLWGWARRVLDLEKKKKNGREERLRRDGGMVSVVKADVGVDVGDTVEDGGEGRSDERVWNEHWGWLGADDDPWAMGSGNCSR